MRSLEPGRGELRAPELPLEQLAEQARFCGAWLAFAGLLARTGLLGRRRPAVGRGDLLWIAVALAVPHLVEPHLARRLHVVRVLLDDAAEFPMRGVEVPAALEHPRAVKAHFQ